MEVLLVKKSTNLDILEESIRRAVARGLISHDELANLEEEHRQHHDCLLELRAGLDKHNISYTEVGRDQALPDRTYDCVISHGGDGTLLTAAQHFSQGARIAGVRSTDNSVGHLCGVGRHEISQFIEKLANHDLSFVAMSRMQARVERIDGQCDITPPVLNDILYTHAHPAGMSRYRLSHNDCHEEQRSSGIWFATAVGSTAAVKAAGGQQLEKTSRDFQYVVRERYRRNAKERQAPASLEKATYNPDKEQVTVFNRSAQAILALDGQRCTYDIEYGDKIMLVRAPDIELVTQLKP